MPVIIKFGLLALGAYLLGAMPSAYLVARWTRGIDIRQYGSGNVGAANVLATVSRWWTVPVTLFDCAKGAAVVYLAKLLGLEVAQQVIIGMAAIVGHNWSVFLRFGGGRGALTAIGALLVLAPWLTLAMVVFAFLFAPFRLLPLGALVALAALPVLGWLLNESFGIERSLSLTLGFVAIFLLLVVRRLTAPRTALSASVSPGELIINRLVFDRDIRDRRAWISRLPETGLVKPSPGQEEKR